MNRSGRNTEKDMEQRPRQRPAAVRPTDEHGHGPARGLPQRGPEPLFESPEPGLRDYLEILVKRLWVIVVVFLAVMTMTIAYTLTRTPIYQSRATVRVNEDSGDSLSSLGEKAKNPLWWRADGEFQTHIEMLQSRALAAELIRKMNLAEAPQFNRKEEPGLITQVMGFVAALLSSMDSAGQKQGGHAREFSREDALIRMIQGRVNASRVADSRFIQVTMTGRDPEFIRRLLENFLEIYVQQDLESRMQTDADALEWLQTELDRVGQKLLASLQEMVKFTREHGLVSMDDESNYHLKFFEKAAEGLVSAREQRVQLEATVQESTTPGDALMLSDAARMDIARMEEKLSTLEAEYAEYSDIYSEDYPKMRLLKNKIQALKDKIHEIERDALDSALASVRETERVQQEAFESAKQEAMDVNSLGVRYAVLKKEVETNEELYRILLRKSKEMELNAKLVKPGVQIVDQPTLPMGPIRPRKSFMIMVGLFLGLTGGIGLALVLEQLDDKVRTSQDVEDKLQLANLGSVPIVGRAVGNGRAARNGHPVELLTHFAPREAAAEAISNVKTSVFLSSTSGHVRTLLVSSALPSEGKTFVAISLAASIASRNRKVLVVDCDLRRPRVGKVFGKKSGAAGLSHLLTRDDVGLKHVIRRTPVPDLYYMPAGKAPPNPVRLIESERMDYFLDKLRDAFDLVILDSPPVLGFSDSQLLSCKSDETVLVVKAGHTPLEMILRADELLRMGGRNTLGVVLNMAPTGGFSYYRGYQYYRYYGYGNYYASSNGDDA